MRSNSRKTLPVWHVLILLCAGVLLAACSDSSTSKQAESDQTAKSTASAPKSAETQPAVTDINACTMLKADEVEAAVGRKSMDPVEYHAAGHMSYCFYGEPGSQMVAGRPQATVLKLTVVSGGNDYFEGPAAQVNAIFDMAAKNGGDNEEVKGMGERAFWAPDLDNLCIVQGTYMVEIEVAERNMAGDKISGDPRTIAEQLARTVLTRLP